jgi:predicted CXXCH cytochrome family protein
MRPIVHWPFRLALLVVLALVGTATASWAAEESPYVGASSCGPCHQKIYQSWLRTKHAKAITKLGPVDKKGECITCHVTGTAAMIAAEKDHPSFENVQCEACHGPGRAHAATPTVKLVKKPSESVCTDCHNKKSPHFRGFVYSAMTPFVHPGAN